MSVSDDVAGEVRAWMARKRRSGRSVALQLGWTQPYMARRLNGAVPFDVADLASIGRALDVPLVAFLAGAGEYAQVSGGRESSDSHAAARLRRVA